MSTSRVSPGSTPERWPSESISISAGMVTPCCRAFAATACACSTESRMTVIRAPCLMSPATRSSLTGAIPTA